MKKLIPFLMMFLLFGVGIGVKDSLANNKTQDFERDLQGQETKDNLEDIQVVVLDASVFSEKMADDTIKITFLDCVEYDAVTGKTSLKVYDFNNTVNKLYTQGED